MKNFIKYMSKSYKDDKINVFSAQASFFIVVSALPFLALIITILGSLSASLVADLETAILSAVPESLHSAVEFVLREVQNTSHFSMISVTAVGAIWASCKGIGAICSGVSGIFSRKDNSFFAYKILRNLGQTFIFLFVMVGSLVAFSVAGIVLNFSKDKMILSLFVEIILRLRAVIFFVILCIFFSLFYYRLSGKQGKLFQHIFGATFASVGWIVFTFFYSIYISNSMKKSYLYAGFGALIFFMLWMYFCIMIIFLGAVINRYLFSIKFFDRFKSKKDKEAKK